MYFPAVIYLHSSMIGLLLNNLRRISGSIIAFKAPMIDKTPFTHKAGGNTAAMIRTSCISMLLTVISGNLAADEFHSLQSIRMQAEDFIHQYPYESSYSPRFKVSALDSRLRLKSCSDPLKIEFARREKTSGNTALNISCPTSSGWKLLLPAQIDLFDDVLILTRTIHKGQIIDTNLVKLKKHNISRLNNGYFSSMKDIVGLEARRNLTRGDILTPSNLVPKLMIKSGQQVTLILDFKGLKIRSTGQALQSARRGEIIKVRNNQSRKIVEGVVSGDAEVRINI